MWYPLLMLTILYGVDGSYYWEIGKFYGRVYPFDDLAWTAGVFLKSSQIVFIESKICSVSLVYFFLVGMDLTPSKTPRAPKIQMFDNCTRDF